LDMNQIDPLALNFLVRRGHAGAALLNVLGCNLAFAGKRDQAVELYSGVERTALCRVKTILGFPPLKSEAFGLCGVSFGCPCRGPGFHSRKLGLQLVVVETDQKIPALNTIVELDENLFDNSGRGCANAYFPPFWLNAPRCRSRPSGLAGH